ncbi:MAG: hypothetical protein DHS20C19_10320 [Acidimicrobiales bacterium]|nr:MAG: hypothetical protein DHS20C19_10320 [Acidimicrobiales bacterium]
MSQKASFWSVLLVVAMTACSPADGDGGAVADAFNGSPLEEAATRFASVASGISTSDSPSLDDVSSFGLLRSCLGTGNARFVLELAEIDTDALANSLLRVELDGPIAVPEQTVDGCG